METFKQLYKEMEEIDEMNKESSIRIEKIQKRFDENFKKLVSSL